MVRGFCQAHGQGPCVYPEKKKKKKKNVKAARTGRKLRQTLGGPGANGGTFKGKGVHSAPTAGDQKRERKIG